MADKADTSSTQARLERLAFLTAEERESLAQDLSEEFDSADQNSDTTAMKTAYDGLNLLDQFEQVLEQMAEVNGSEKPGAESEPEPEEKPEPSSEPEETPEQGDEGEGESETEKNAPKAKSAGDKDTEKSDEDDEDEESSGDEKKTSDADSAVPVTELETSSDSEKVGESEVLAMAASAVENPEELKPATTSPAVVVASAYAGANVRGYTAGERFRSVEDIAEAMTDQINAMGGMSGDGTRSLVASFRGTFPEDRQLSNKDALVNQLKIDAVAGEKAIVASGGFCAPLPVNYDIFGVGSTARPVRDSLPSFGATRGGIRFIAPPTLGSYTNALSVWTAANDANPTAPTTKPRLKVNCANELTATTDAITLSLEFGNLMTRAFPELVQRHNQLALVEHARLAEKTLLSKISALSSKVTTGHVYGTGRDLLIHLSEAMAAYRNRHRIPRPIRLRAIMPEWVRDAVREDIATNMNMGVQDISIGDAAVDGWFANRGVSVTWHMDDTFAAQTLPGALNGFPSSIKFWLFAEGTILFLDGGTLDLGVVRDADLVATNDYITFVETFEGIAKVGIEVLEVTATTQIGLPAAAP